MIKHPKDRAERRRLLAAKKKQFYKGWHSLEHKAKEYQDVPTGGLSEEDKPTTEQEG